MRRWRRFYHQHGSTGSFLGDSQATSVRLPNLLLVSDEYRVGYLLEVRVSCNARRSTTLRRRKDQAVRQAGLQSLLQPGSLHRNLLVNWNQETSLLHGFPLLACFLLSVVTEDPEESLSQVYRRSQSHLGSFDEPGCLTRTRSTPPVLYPSPRVNQNGHVFPGRTASALSDCPSPTFSAPHAPSEPRVEHPSSSSDPSPASAAQAPSGCPHLPES